MRRLALFPTLVLAVAACAPAGDADGERGVGEDVRIVVVTHGQSADPFWSVVANGVRDAAADMGVRAEYQAPTRFDMVEMASLIDAAVASRPAGLVVSVPDPDALGPSIRAAIEAGIPVISINSGADAYQQLGILAHVGQTEYEAGHAGGERLADAGARRVLCVNHEVGNMAQDLRCRGAADALEAAGGALEVLAVDLADPEDTQQRVAGALARAAYDGLLTLGPAAAGPALAALAGHTRGGPPRDDGRDAVVFGTFDLTPEILAGIADGRIAFAIDQQQYLQGYLPIVLLANYAETLTMPGGGDVIRTGPGFVTAENAERVMALTERGIR